MANQNVAPSDNSELEWIRFREDTLGDQAFPNQQESGFLTKFKSNPFVPIGAAATVAALVYGLYCFKNGDTKRSQTMMRTRVAAQGFTVVAMLGGMMFASRGNNTRVSQPTTLKSEPK